MFNTLITNNMCLLIDLKAIQKIATRDMKAYKVLKIEHSGELYTPVMKLKVPKNGILKPKGFREGQDIPVDRDSFFSYNAIEKGAIHCYKSRKTASIMRPLDGGVILKAIIPKGTKYYKDIHGLEYACQKLVLSLPKF